MIRALDKWLVPYLLRRRRPRHRGPVDLVIAVCDHFEPFHHTDRAGAIARVERWAAAFPELIAPFRDSDQRPPKHSFFYPIEQYDEEVIDRLSEICRRTGSEVEIHLHHDGDDAGSLADKIEKGKSDLSAHGLLSRDRSGNTVYGFIHGDWALDHSHPSGRHCGVADELGVLRRTGCYADFTMPSAPSPTQAKVVNAIYYARCTPEPRSHDRGTPLSVESPSRRGDLNQLLLFQGPLAFNWRWRKHLLVPRIENGDLTGANPPTACRLSLWLDVCPHVGGRPDVVFVKLHTHGAIERNSEMLLGEPMRVFHREATGDQRFRLHYVTAREMANIAHALEDGEPSPVGELRDYLYRSKIDFA